MGTALSNGLDRPGEEIIGLQVLRAFAALCVAMLHIQGEAGAMLGTPGVSPWPLLAGLPWEAGVDLFFVISGFVMVYASRPLFGMAGATRIFLSRRIARIVPLYWLVTTMFMLTAVFGPVALDNPFGSWEVVVASYLFLPWQRPNGSFLPIFRLGWTLEYEMLFYVIFALAVRMRMQLAVTLSGATLLALVLYKMAADAAMLHPILPQLIFWSDPIVLDFCFGMFVGSWMAPGDKPASAMWLTGGAGLLMLAVNPVALGLPRWLGFGLPATALLLACLAPIRQSRLRTLLERVGSASYALYLTHLFAARMMREIWMRLIGPAWLELYLVAALAGSVVLALLVHWWFEIPTTRWARRRLAGSWQWGEPRPASL